MRKSKSILTARGMVVASAVVVFLVGLSTISAEFYAAIDGESTYAFPASSNTTPGTMEDYLTACTWWSNVASGRLSSGGANVFGPGTKPSGKSQFLGYFWMVLGGDEWDIRPAILELKRTSRSDANYAAVQNLIKALEQRLQELARLRSRARATYKQLGCGRPIPKSSPGEAITPNTSGSGGIPSGGGASTKVYRGIY